MKLYKLILVFLGISLACSMSAKDLSQARIYINPGHGGWGPNDRPLATINYPVLDTLGFFETNTDLIKGQSLRDELQKAGAGYIKMSRTKNGIVSAGDPHKTPNDEYEGNGQIVTLSVICEDVETNNIDYFISIHSNANVDGTMANYPLLLYRGTDAAPGNGLVDAKNMAIDAWKYVVNNGVTYYSAYTAATANNNRGDISFMGSSTTTNGYTGYYGVLRHGADGFLSEGCFHTYQPERHRLLNDDYCRQEGVRYSRAIRAWFGDNTETKGAIMGTVKDISKPLEHALYTYKVNSIDAYYPLNNVTVILQDNKGVELKKYTTDKEYNGIFVFTDLAPGTYKLLYDIPGYWKESEEIEVIANETSFTNKRLTDTSKEEPSEEIEDPEVEYYPHPIQDGDIAAASSYNFIKESELKDIAPLKDLTIRRAILRDNKYYVLAVDANKNPKLMVLDPTTGSLVKDMSLDGVVRDGYNGKKYPYILSDITFTNDGVLLATNSTVVGRENNAFQTGDFYMYKWQAADGVALEDATPKVLLTLPTNNSASLLAAGNNNSNFMANSIAVNGNLDNFKFYFDSHAGGGWNTTYGMIYMCWQVENGVLRGSQRNDTGLPESQLGEDVRITLSPLGLDRFIIDGNKMAPREYQINWEASAIKKVADFNGDVPVESTGANYFRYTNKIYMSAPICEKQGATYSYKSRLFDITEGLDKAKKIGDTDAAITNQPAVTYMAGAGVVDNADINQYLLVGNNIVKNTTKGQAQAQSPARIFAYNLTSTATAEGYDISYELNENAESVELIFTESETDTELESLPLSALAKGKNTVSVAKADIPTGTSNWSLRVVAGNVTKLTKLSDNSNAYSYFAPKGVSVDKSPESPYFGRVYVTNTAAGTANGRPTAIGLYVLGADGSDITSQGNNAYNGGLSWTGANAESPRKLAVASDGRLFVCDASAANAGIYYVNPATFAMSSVFTGATNSAGKLTINGTYVAGQMTAIGIRGTGANTQLYAVDKTASGIAWKKLVNVYNIGEATTWTKAPTSSSAASSYLGNDNNSIAPVGTGYWAGQYRGPGGNSTANPCMFYYSDEYKEAVFNTAEPNVIATSSQNGALAVNEKENTIALSNNGGVSVFTYKMKKDGTPIVTEKFKSTLASTGVTYDDFEFDYAGNLYAVSHSGKSVSVWAMPTDNNSCIIPAQKSMTLINSPVGLEETEKESVNIYPNPTADIVTIDLPTTINTVEVYNISGALVHKVKNVNSLSTTIDFTSFAQGVYLVKVNNGQAIRVIKK